MAATTSRPSKARSRFLNEEDSADSDYSLNDDSEAEVSVSEPTSFETVSRPVMAPPDPRKPTFRIQPSLEKQRLDCVKEHGAGRHFSKNQNLHQLQAQEHAAAVRSGKINPVDDIANTTAGAYSVASFVRESGNHFNAFTFPKLLRLAETVDRSEALQKLDRTLRSDYAPFKNAKRTFDEYVAGQRQHSFNSLHTVPEPQVSRVQERRPIARRQEHPEPEFERLARRQPSLHRRETESAARDVPLPSAEDPEYDFSDEDDYGDAAVQDDSDDALMAEPEIKAEEPETALEPVNPALLGAKAFSIFSVGDTFDSRQHGRDTITPHLGRKKVHWRHDKSDGARMYLRCARDPACAMRVRLVPIKIGLFAGRWRIRELKQHSCELQSVPWPFPDINKPEKNRRRGRPPKIRKADRSLWAPDSDAAASGDGDMDIDDLSDDAAGQDDQVIDPRLRTNRTTAQPKSKQKRSISLQNASSALIVRLPRKQNRPARREVAALHDGAKSELITLAPNNFLQQTTASSTLSPKLLALRCIRARKKIDAKKSKSAPVLPSGPVLRRNIKQTTTENSRSQPTAVVVELS